MKGRVLLCGGASGFRQKLRSALQDGGYEVAPAANGDEADELFQRTAIDILVVDGDGDAEATRFLLTRWTARHPDLCVIVLAESRQAIKPGWAGVNVWMNKPLHPSQVVAAVDNLRAVPAQELFRAELLRRRDAPLLSPVASRGWVLNE